MTVKVTVDHEVNAAYISLSSETVARTEELSSGILIDLDAMGMVVGIEVLSLDLLLPLDRLRTEFHVHSSVVDLLEQLRPSISFQVNFQHGAEGTSSRVGQPVSA